MQTRQNTQIIYFNKHVVISLCATETIHAIAMTCPGTCHYSTNNYEYLSRSYEYCHCPIHSSLPLSRDIMLTLTLGASCESAILMAKILCRHDSSDLGTKGYYRETVFGMNF